MGINNENINPNPGTIFFIVLFLLFALVYSGRSENQTSVSSGDPFQYDLASGNSSTHSVAIVFSAISLPELYKNCVNALHNTSLDLFSFQYILSNYNHRTTQNFIDIQKTSLAIEPLFPWRLSYHLYSSENEDLPFLS